MNAETTLPIVAVGFAVMSFAFVMAMAALVICNDRFHHLREINKQTVKSFWALNRILEATKKQLSEQQEQGAER